MRLFWYHMPHTPLGILDISLVAGNDVNMDMQNALPSRRPYVNADVVAIRLELLVQQLALLGDQLHTGADLFGRQVKEAGHMTLRDNHGVPRAHRVTVTSTVCKLVTQ